MGYGKIVDGQVQRANYIDEPGVLITNPTDAQWAEYGYKKIIEPVVPSGKLVIETGYEIMDDKIVIQYETENDPYQLGETASIDAIRMRLNTLLRSTGGIFLLAISPLVFGQESTPVTASTMSSAKQLRQISGTTPVYSATEVDALTDPLWNYMLDKSFRVTVTNYDSVVHAPMAYFEYRLTPDEPWRTVWSETNALWGAVEAATNLAHQAAQAPAEKAWGQYDSLTGQRVPEGVVQVQAEGGMVIGGGMGWSAVEGTQYWVLTSTDPTLCATGAEGRFEIKDADGKSAIQVIKGDKKLVPARAESITAQGAGMMTINYSVVAASAPVLEVASELAGPWYTQGASDCPADVTWAGESGAWVARANCHGAPKMFFRAMYEQGGDSYVNIGAAGGIGFDTVRIKGTNYPVRVEIINGKKLLVLGEE